MKRKKIMILIIVFVLLILGTIGLVKVNSTDQIKEYGIVVEETDLDYKNEFGDGKAYEIGLNKVGKPIFKDTDMAFEQMLLDYKDGLEEVRKEFGLRKITKKNWKKYFTYSGQLSGDSKYIKEGNTIAGFFDIYENSFDE